MELWMYPILLSIIAAIGIVLCAICLIYTVTKIEFPMKWTDWLLYLFNWALNGFCLSIFILMLVVFM